MAYQHTYRLSHILPALLVKCHFENVSACIYDQRDVILSSWPRCLILKINAEQCMDIDPKTGKHSSVNAITLVTVEVTLRYIVIQLHGG